ncbi:hypothetical protein IFM89_013331 [Coptis chinensis]|uniref:Uncharacterized protein n=1 Tax=Coptis chinensis TaxID=261450 RepID=A0A835LMD4_9MAGN|nr:hypothetical protein IFM89_013331 [Coptis chinensis]
MAKKTTTKKTPENLGKGKVTPVQIAFIVDRYLSDNNFTQTRSSFRTEASNLISKTNVKEAPKSLLSLDAILDEYICLKEQKVLLGQEKVRVDEEKHRVELLLQGMQNVMQAYNSSSPCLVSKSTDLVTNSNGNPANKTPTVASTPWLLNNNVDPKNFTTPSTNPPPENKRKGSRPATSAPTTTKRQCRRGTKNQSLSAGTAIIPFQGHNAYSTGGMVPQKISALQSSFQPNLAVSCVATGSSVRESSVAESLFTQPSSSLKANSPSPKTPPQACITQVDNSISPVENSSVINSAGSNNPKETSASNCAMISSCSESVYVSPSKHIACYSMERSHYFTSSSPGKTYLKRPAMREHVKGRLDFGASNVPMSSDQPLTDDIPMTGSNEDIFDMDVPNFDIFGSDFSLSEFLVGIDLSCGQGTNPATGVVCGEPHESGFGNLEATQSFSEFPSSLTLCEKDMNIQGQDSMASVKSYKKCITISSPVKNRRSIALDQENVVTRN